MFLLFSASWVYDCRGGEKMFRRILFAFGIAAPLLYVLIVVAGGALRPGYSHLSMAVSELTETGAPNKLFLDIAFIVYNALLIVFAWADGMGIRGQDLRLRMTGCWILGFVGLVGTILAAFFPMDPRGAPQTATGLIHLILAGVLSLGSILTILFIGIGSKVRDAFWVYSFVSAILVVVTGGFGAALSIRESPYMGLAERITVALFLQWIFAHAVRLLREDKGKL
jgi:hypothetical membrane protein